MRLTDVQGRPVDILTVPAAAGTRLLLTIYPRKAWAGRLLKASAHLHLELSPADCRQLVAGLTAYLRGAEEGEAEVEAGVPV